MEVEKVGNVQIVLSVLVATSVYWPTFLHGKIGGLGMRLGCYMSYCRPLLRINSSIL